jgi:NAD(P)-dependent dehydrogenase (short-subunit alcohol dehydrogenase family)
MPGADTTRWIQTEQVAHLLVSLASDEVSQVTGAAIPIYGRDL